MALAACLPAAPGYFRAWIERGSPLYPFELRVAGVVVLSGNQERAMIHSATIVRGLKFDPVKLLDALFVPHPERLEEHLGLGPLAAPFAVLCAVGWRRLTRGRAPPQNARLPARARRTTAVALVLVIAVVLTGFLSESERAVRTLFALSAGRFLALPYASFLALASRLRGRWMRGAWAAVLGTHLALGLPLGWSREDLAAMLALMPALAGALALMLMLFCVLHARRSRRGRFPVAAALCMLAAGVIGSPLLQSVRDEYRHSIYVAAGQGRAYDAHALDPRYATSWPIWRFFDGAGTGPDFAADHAKVAEPSDPTGSGARSPSGSRLAVTAGFDGIGHNVYRYPLFGRRLQNDVRYVTPMRDGSVVDYRLAETLAAGADPRAWERRMLEQGCQFIITLAPRSLESIFIERSVEGFEPVARSTCGRSAAYRLTRGS